jgi:hypothetical protein
MFWRSAPFRNKGILKFIHDVCKGNISNKYGLSTESYTYMVPIFYMYMYLIISSDSMFNLILVKFTSPKLLAHYVNYLQMSWEFTIRLSRHIHKIDHNLLIISWNKKHLDQQMKSLVPKRYKCQIQNFWFDDIAQIKYYMSAKLYGRHIVLY